MSEPTIKSPAATCHVLAVYRKGSYSDTFKTEDFTGTEAEASAALSDLWNRETPVDGTGWRATRRRVGERAIVESIGW